MYFHGYERTTFIDELEIDDKLRYKLKHVNEYITDPDVLKILTYNDTCNLDEFTNDDYLVHFTCLGLYDSET